MIAMMLFGAMGVFTVFSISGSLIHFFRNLNR
jgi:hypothetical protein